MSASIALAGAEEVFALANGVGFECIGACDASLLRARPEVRDMCSSDRCRSYGRNWACPPHCGSIASYQALFDRMAICLLLQTVGALEDEFDIESMMEADALHHSRLNRFRHSLRRIAPDAIVLGAGPCGYCSRCRCPDDPCCYPSMRTVSMEAAGLVVSDVCLSCGVPYNHGKNTIAYSSCVMLSESE